MTDAIPLRHVSLSQTDLDRLQHGAVQVAWPSSIFRIDGPGAVACVQGIVTNDVQKRGPGTVCYGALLTPKGMLVLDCWLLRDGDAIVLVADASAHAAALDLFRRQLPPRLAKVHDLSTTHRVHALAGHDARTRGAAFGAPTEPGRVVRQDGDRLVAQLPAAAPAGVLVVAPADAMPVLGEPGDASLAEAARILAGFPALGAEIDEKTLPQEVRFDEHEGVSYTKGCYTGQETVARIHFRGHPNRELRALRIAAGRAIDPAQREIVHEGKTVGLVRSLLETPSGSVALAPVRREVALGSTVALLGTEATVEVPPIRLG